MCAHCGGQLATETAGQGRAGQSKQDSRCPCIRVTAHPRRACIAWVTRCWCERVVSVWLHLTGTNAWYDFANSIQTEKTVLRRTFAALVLGAIVQHADLPGHRRGLGAAGWLPPPHPGCTVANKRRRFRLLRYQLLGACNSDGHVPSRCPIATSVRCCGHAHSWQCIW